MATDYASAAIAEWSQSPYFPAAQTIAGNFGIDPTVFSTMIGAESGYNPNARNPSGAFGLGQLMPSTAVAMDVDPTSPLSNLEGSAAYFSQLLQQCNGDYVCASTKYGTLPSNLQNLTNNQQLLLNTEQSVSGQGVQCQNMGGIIGTICTAPAGASSAAFGTQQAQSAAVQANASCGTFDYLCQIKAGGANLLTIISGIIVLTIGLVMLKNNVNPITATKQIAGTIKRGAGKIIEPTAIIAE